MLLAHVIKGAQAVQAGQLTDNDSFVIPIGLFGQGQVYNLKKPVRSEGHCKGRPSILPVEGRLILDNEVSATLTTIATGLACVKH